MKSKLLACRIYPLPNGTNYFEKDLIVRNKVIELFDYCQIFEAIIYDIGWEFLFKNYSLKELIDIDKESSWFDDEDTGETIKYFYYHSLLSGFDAYNLKFGEYSETLEIFKPLEETSYQIDWGKIYNLKDEL